MADMKRNLEFLFEIGSQRHLNRAWSQHLATSCASNLEHTLRVLWIALILARNEGVKNEEKILKMALVHDIAESRVSDLGYIQKVYVKSEEDKAAQDIFAHTCLEYLYKDMLVEYEKRESIESKIVKDADNLDVDLELKELEERGSQLPKKWKTFRRMVRNKKLYTKSAKMLWDKIQKADVASWHLEANKWVKIKSAGR